MAWEFNPKVLGWGLEVRALRSPVKFVQIELIKARVYGPCFVDSGAVTVGRTVEK